VRFRRRLDPEETEQAVRELGWWHHHFQLPNGVWTGHDGPPGYNPLQRWEPIAAYLPDELAGASVLDVGGNSGYFSLQMKLRGAGRCVMVEPIPEYANQARFVFSQFDVRVKLVPEDVHTYCLTTRERFDYVLFLGLFYHLRYPQLVLDRLAQMTRRRLFLQSHVVGALRQHEPRPDVEIEEVGEESFPRLAFIENAYRSDKTNWWLPNYSAVEALARSAGLRVVSRPTPEMLVAEPARELETLRRRRLVFPRLDAQFDAGVWNQLRAGTFRQSKPR
jgi:tRNA (mo5U34)-methyltransferase